ncbi:hypothetical protein HY570_01325 [Candidatus Micrarchaeota archaeon]|nr:hypothetical protein [Candidatus Micrarchaeota archaeon]
MAIDDALISTGVDSLIKLVHSVKKVELSDAALKLGIPAETIEEWAHILEDEGILKIEYKLTKVYLAWVGVQPKELLRRSEAFQEQKEEIRKEVQFLLARLEDPGLDSMQVQLGKFLGGFNEKIQAVRKAKETYRTLQEEKQSIFSRYSKLAQRSEEDLKRYTLSLDGIQKRLEKLRTEIAAIKERTSIDDVEKAYNKLRELQKVYSSLNESCEDEISKIKKLKRDYDTDIKELDSAYSEVEAGLAKAEQDLARSMQEAGSIIESVESLLAKKPELEELSNITNEIQLEKNKITRQLTVLAKEVSLLNIQTTPEIQKLKEKVTANVKEEELYEEKRKRLLVMVKKMLAQETGKESKGGA